jgi:hypothetical protein
MGPQGAVGHVPGQGVRRVGARQHGVKQECVCVRVSHACRVPQDVYASDSGFPITYADQLAYSTWLVDQAHQRNMSIAYVSLLARDCAVRHRSHRQKNDYPHASSLSELFDFAIIEDCFQEGWCSAFDT